MVGLEEDTPKGWSTVKNKKAEGKMNESAVKRATDGFMKSYAKMGGLLKSYFKRMPQKQWDKLAGAFVYESGWSIAMLEAAAKTALPEGNQITVGQTSGVMPG